MCVHAGACRLVAVLREKNLLRTAGLDMNLPTGVPRFCQGEDAMPQANCTMAGKSTVICGSRDDCLNVSRNVFPYLCPSPCGGPPARLPWPLSSLLPSLHAGEDLPQMRGEAVCLTVAMPRQSVLLQFPAPSVPEGWTKFQAEVPLTSYHTSSRIL